MTRWLRAAAMLFAALLGIESSARAQDGAYPNKPVKIINDSAAGSATDVTARLLADRLCTVWGQQVIADNKPGRRRLDRRARASERPADGYTLYVGAASTFTALKGAPGVAPNLPIELPRDFAPIGFMTSAADVHRRLAEARRQLAAGTDRARQEEAGRIVLRHHRPRTHHAPDHGAAAEPRRHQAADDPLHRRPACLDARRRHRPGRHRHRRLFGPRRRPDQRHHQGHRGVLGEAAADFKDLPTVAETLPGFVAGGWNVLLAPIGTPEAIIERPAPTYARRSTTRT